MPINGLGARQRALRPPRLQDVHRARPRRGPRARRDLPAHPVLVLDAARGAREGRFHASMQCGFAAALVGGARAAPSARRCRPRRSSLLDGRVQIHGYYEAQIRSLVRDFDYLRRLGPGAVVERILTSSSSGPSAPDGFGPFDTINVFGRARGPLRLRLDPRLLDVRLGQHLRRPHRQAAEAALRRAPQRLRRARNWTGDTRHYYDVPFTDVNAHAEPRAPAPVGRADCPWTFFQTPIGAPFFGSGSYGLDGIPASTRTSTSATTTRRSSTSSRCSARTATSGASGRGPNGSAERPRRPGRPAPRSGLRLRHHRRPPPTSRTPSAPATSTR